MTMHQLYPMLTPDKCTAIHGYYEIGMQTEQTKFIIEKESDEFQELCDLFYEREYRRGLRDLFPRGVRTHRTEPEDYQWEVFFRFEDIEFPDGSIAKPISDEDAMRRIEEINAEKAAQESQE